MKSNVVKSNDPIVANDHNTLVEDVKDIYAQIAQIPEGKKGEKGEKGEKGDAGAKGVKGDKGDAGIGVKAIQFTKDAKGAITGGTMTMTDNTTQPITIA